MKAAFIAFKRDVAELRWFIESLEYERSVLVLLPECQITGDAINPISSWHQHLSVGSTIKRRFDYTSIVITLYGLLEHFIEGIIIGYTKELNALYTAYADLPDSIKNAHIELSMSLMARIKQGRYKGDFTESSIISDLNSCLNQGAPYKLNHDAFALHSANFRIQLIDEIFSRIGVVGVSQKLVAFSPFADHLMLQFHGRNLPSVPLSETFFLIDDLAERRNEVAHGPVSELLSYELLLDYVAYVEKFCIALFEFVRCNIIEHALKIHGVELGQPIRVYNHNIICIHLDGATVEVGDLLIASTGDTKRPIRFGAIERIEKDRQSLVMASGIPYGLDVGIQVPFSARDNHVISLISKSKWS